MHRYDRCTSRGCDRCTRRVVTDELVGLTDAPGGLTEDRCCDRYIITIVMGAPVELTGAAGCDRCTITIFTLSQVVGALLIHLTLIQCDKQPGVQINSHLNFRDAELTFILNFQKSITL